MKLKIDGAAYTDRLWDDQEGSGGGSITITSIFGARGSMSLALKDFSGTCRPNECDDLEVYSPTDSDLAFGGSIDEVDFDAGDLWAQGMDIKVQASDRNEIPGRHLGVEVYTSAFAGDIYTDLIAKYLAQDGVTVGMIETGPLVAQFIVNWELLNSAFTRLDAITGMGHHINYDKSFDAVARTTMTAPFSIDDTTTLVTSIKLKKSKDQFRNRQIVIGGKGTTNAQTETFAGDGQRTTFTLGFPVAIVPSSIKVNGVTKTIGIGSIDTGKDWYWNSGSNQIIQDSGGTKLEDTDILSVTYQGLFDTIGLSQDDASIAARAAASGESGIYDNRSDQTAIHDATQAIFTAEALIARFNAPPQLLITLYQLDGLKVGQLVTVTASQYGISARQFLITNITATCTFQDNHDSWSYSVTCVDGYSWGGWASFFVRLAQATMVDATTASQLVSFLRSQAENMRCLDSFSVSSGAPVTTCDDGFADFMECT